MADGLSYSRLFLISISDYQPPIYIPHQLWKNFSEILQQEDYSACRHPSFNSLLCFQFKIADMTGMKIFLFLAPASQMEKETNSLWFIFAALVFSFHTALFSFFFLFLIVWYIVFIYVIRIKIIFIILFILHKKKKSKYKAC